MSNTLRKTKSERFTTGTQLNDETNISDLQALLHEKRRAIDGLRKERETLINLMESLEAKIHIRKLANDLECVKIDLKDQKRIGMKRLA